MKKKNSTHLDLCHRFWEEILDKGDITIDATCGNGLDTLFLAKCTRAKVYGYDIQKQAIDQTNQLLKSKLSDEQFRKIQLFHMSHETFSKEHEKEKIKLIVYNLGYLPKSDKSITTKVNTTLKSIQNALELIDYGAISITCYPHPEGKKEEEAILSFAKTLSKDHWQVSYYQWINRSSSPSLIFISSLSLQKKSIFS